MKITLADGYLHAKVHDSAADSRIAHCIYFIFLFVEVFNELISGWSADKNVLSGRPRNNECNELNEEAYK